MMIFWLVILGVLIYFLVNGNLTIPSNIRNNAHNHLDERLAKGDISIDEYKTLKTTMRRDKHDFI